MPIFFPDILEERSEPTSFRYSEKDVILYALGIGYGADPLDPDQLRFVYEDGLKVVPTAITVLHGPLARPDLRSDRPGHRPSSVNAARVVHGAQKIVLHRPLPPAGEFVAQTRITGAFDKGEKGAVLIYETDWTDTVGETVASLIRTRFARADGGFGGPSDGIEPPAEAPSRSPDISIEFTTRLDQALLYRLNGDWNPLHASPAFAGKAGFDRPILHGLCTFGMTCRAVMAAFPDCDADAILSHEARFSAPLYPGETIIVDLWRDDREIAFEASVKERGRKVITGGRCVLRDR